MAAAALGKNPYPRTVLDCRESASICREQIEAAIEAGGKPVQASSLEGD
jgi:hypothetical protein